MSVFSSAAKQTVKRQQKQAIKKGTSARNNEAVRLNSNRNASSQTLFGASSQTRRSMRRGMRGGTVMDPIVGARDMTGGERVKSLGSGVKDYMWGGTKGQIAARNGAAAGAIIGTAVGLDALDGSIRD